MKKKVAFIAFSDIQIEDWKQHSHNHSRLYDNGKILETIRNQCKRYKVPALFCGDLFDNPHFLSNLVLNTAFSWLSLYHKEEVNILGIPGNHDQCDQNSNTHCSPNYFSLLSKTYPWIKDVSFAPERMGNYIITGIPFLTNNKGFEDLVRREYRKVQSAPQRKILLIHTDLPGAVDTNGREIESHGMKWNLKKIFKGWDLVLSGHIHKPQKIRSNILMVGATHQQRVSDSGTDMGYWLIYEDLTFKFIKLDMPQFKYLAYGVEKPNDHHFYIEEQKNPVKELEDKYNFNTTIPEKLSKSYCKAKGIKSKKKRTLLTKYLSC